MFTAGAVYIVLSPGYCFICM